nr:DUF3800 domain-containing protein [Parasphingorhabdus marina]
MDDSGSRNPDHGAQNRADKMDWFALGGVMMESSASNSVLSLHSEFVQKWNIDTPLHSTKIRGRRREFSWIGKDETVGRKFYEELGHLLCNVPLVGFACAIDRPGYNARYSEKYGDDRWLMCKTAYSILVERASKFAVSRDAKLEVYFEQAGKHEDRNLVEYHKELKTHGMPFDRGASATYSSLSAEEFSNIVLGDPQRLTKKSPLIQFADLYLYPLIKGGYDINYPPYRDLREAKRIVDAIIPENQVASCGVKYSCFELVRK